jgi:hypothetical protein
LVVAVAELGPFSWLRDNPGVKEEAICCQFGLAAHPVDVLITYLHRSVYSIE